MGTKRTVRLALIGLGEWARRAYLPNIALIDEVEIVALCTRSRANMEAALKCVSGSPLQFNDYRQMLQWGKMDGVIVAAAASSHGELVEAVLKAGFPVLCEKPLAPSVQECDALLELSRRQGVLLQVGLEFRHAPICVRAAEITAEGRIGQPMIVFAQVIRDKCGALMKKPERYTAPGGVFSEFLCHYLDLMTWFSQGKAITISADCGRQLGTEVFDHGALGIAYSNGAMGILVYSMLSSRSGEATVVGAIGTEGRFEVDLLRNELRLFSSGSADAQCIRPEPVDHPNLPYPGSFEQIVSFADCIRRQAPPRVPGEVGRELVALTLAADKSAKTSAKVTVS